MREAEESPSVEVIVSWCPRYITSGLTQQKTSPPAILLFLSWAVA
jgi:hypothetical protein